MDYDYHFGIHKLKSGCLSPPVIYETRDLRVWTYYCVDNKIEKLVESWLNCNLTFYWVLECWLICNLSLYWLLESWLNCNLTFYWLLQSWFKITGYYNNLFYQICLSPPVIYETRDLRVWTYYCVDNKIENSW
jgi:hypothetical protein